MRQRVLTQRKRAINWIIEKAVQEQIAQTGLENPDYAAVLRRFQHDISHNAGSRITDDIGRMRRLLQLAGGK